MSDVEYLFMWFFWPSVYLLWRVVCLDLRPIFQWGSLFITLEICLLVLLILQPQHFDVLLSLLLTVVSPLIGHFLSLTHSKLSNITFFTLIIAALALTIFNIWMP